MSSKRERNFKQANDTAIRRILMNHGFGDSKIIDRRDKPRGALWVITSKPRYADSDFFDKLWRRGYEFRYVEKGTKDTDHRAAWYWLPEKPAPQIEETKGFKRFQRALGREQHDFDTVWAALQKVADGLDASLTVQLIDHFIAYYEEHHPHTLSPLVIAALRAKAEQLTTNESTKSASRTSKNVLKRSDKKQ